MGDLLQTTPLMAGLKKEYSECQLSVLVNKGFAEICNLIPFIDKLYTIDLGEFIPMLVDSRFSLIDNYYYLENLVEDLNSERFKMVINLTPTRVSAQIASLLKAPDIRGLLLDRKGGRIIKHPWANYFFNASQNRGFNRYNLVDMFSKCGDVSPNGRKLYLDIPSEAKEFTRQFLIKNKISNGTFLIGFQPGASQENKRWPISSFARLGDILKRRYGAKIVLFGSSNEKGLGEEMESLMQTRPINAIGKTNLAELAALLSRCDLLITNDTGTMHIATAVGTRVIGLFLGPVLSFETGPYGEGNLILEADIPCAPCNHWVQCKNPVCKEYISVNDVLKAVEITQLLKKKKINYSSLSFDGARIKIFATTFDDDNMLEFIPLTRHSLNKEDLFATAYRVMWEITLNPVKYQKVLSRSNPKKKWEGDELIKSEVKKMVQRYSSSFEVEDLRELLDSIQEDMDSLRRLIHLSYKGLSLCEDLIRLSQKPKLDVPSIKQLGRKFPKIDEEITLLGMTHPSLRPLTSMFDFDKENIRDDGFFTLVLRTSRLYRSLYNGSSIIYHLINDSLGILSRNANRNGSVEKKYRIITGKRA
jgi:ADP-heptose:LPS heptosyltransferase